MDTYENAIVVAVSALSDGFHDEYRRGVVNVIAELFARPGVTVDERMEEVEADIARRA